MKLKTLRENLPFLHERLQVKPVLRNVPLQASAAILDQLSTWRLPEQKTACLAWVVRSVQNACRKHVRLVHGQQRRAEMERKETRVSPPPPQPVEITVDDLVGLLLVTAALSQGRLLLANLWMMNLFNLQRPREAQFDEASFHLTTLQSALSFACVVSVPQTQTTPRRGEPQT
ncbi:vacuolar sorting 9 (VPS9 domain) protein [Toxoplasma gondii ARI]|nr:vacuolar sorting 9 (VPS9 domain) protein [Toxoplasma gondii ARI]